MWFYINLSNPNVSYTCNIHFIYTSFTPTHWHYFRPFWELFFIWAADISSSSSQRLQPRSWQHVVWGTCTWGSVWAHLFLLDKSSVFCVRICLCVCFQILPAALSLDGPDLLLASASKFTHPQLIQRDQLPHLHSRKDRLTQLPLASFLLAFPCSRQWCVKNCGLEFLPAFQPWSSAVLCLRPLLSTGFCPCSVSSSIRKIFTLTPYLHSAPAFSMCLTFSSPARYVGCFFPFLFRRNAMKVCAIFSRAVTLLAIRGINHSDLMTHPAHESFSSLPKPKPGMLGLFLLSSCWSKAVLESVQICQLQHFDLSLWSR